jgi:hypothetical protein
MPDDRQPGASPAARYSKHACDYPPAALSRLAVSAGLDDRPDFPYADSTCLAAAGMVAGPRAQLAGGPVRLFTPFQSM